MKLLVPAAASIGALAAGVLVRAYKDCVACRKETLAHGEKELRENLSEKQIDKMLMDSFPASDPSSTY